MGGPSAPPPPNYEAAAEKTASGNKELYQMQLNDNRVTRVNPFGKSAWTKDVNGMWTETISLDPAEQAALDRDRTSVAGRATTLDDLFKSVVTKAKARAEAPSKQSNLNPLKAPESRNYDFERLTTDRGSKQSNGLEELFSQLGSGLENKQGDAYDQKMADAAYSRGTRFSGPANARKRESLEATLSDQGFSRGSEGYKRAVDDFETNVAQQEGDARDRAIMAGRDAGESERNFSLSRENFNLNKGQFGLQTDAQKYEQASNDTQLRNSSTMGNNQLSNAQTLQKRSDDQYGVDIQRYNNENERLDRTTAVNEESAVMDQLMNLLGLNTSGASSKGSTPQSAGITGPNRPDGPDYMDAASKTYDAKMQGFNAKQANRMAWLSAISGTAKAAAGGGR